MVYVKWTFWGLFWLLLASFLHYTLPHSDVVRLTDTYERRVTPGTNSIFWSNADTGDKTSTEGRDVFFIRSADIDDNPMIYRNEDTGWGWPPYFKFNSSNVQAVAQDLGSNQNAETPTWVAVRHYGWRNEFLSTYPNAISVREVAGPDVRIIPWFSIVVLILLAALLWAIRARWTRFWRNREARAADEWNDGTA